MRTYMIIMIRVCLHLSSIICSAHSRPNLTPIIDTLTSNMNQKGVTGPSGTGRMIPEAGESQTRTLKQTRDDLIELQQRVRDDPSTTTHHKRILSGCHFTCLTCSGSSSSKCTSCPSGRYLDDNRCRLITQLNPCSVSYRPVLECGCAECFELKDFKENVEVCSTDYNVRYYDWEVIAKWTSDSRTSLSLQFRFSSLNEKFGGQGGFFEINSTQLMVTSSVLTDRHTITMDGREGKVLAHNNKDDCQIELSKWHLDQLRNNQKLELKIENSEIVSKNLIWNDTNKKMLLVHKKIVIQLVSEEDQTSSKMTEKMKPFIQAALKTFSAIAISSSLCSFQFTFAFIKLFQIIEILGKFYFLPLKFSLVLGIFLHFIYGLSDIIVTSPDIIQKKRNEETTTWMGKLTQNKIDKYLMRTIPVVLIIYLLLKLLSTAFDIVLKREKFRRNRIVKRLSTALSSLLYFFILANNVDLIFYAMYAIIGSWRKMSLLSYFNKGLAIWVLHDILAFTFKVSLVTLSMRRHEGDTRHVNHVLKETAFEGLKFDKKVPAAARLINTYFYGRIIFFQLCLVGLQKTPGPCIVALTSVQLLSTIYTVYLWIKFKPFSSIGSTIEKMIIEGCLSIFMIAVSLQLFGIYLAVCEFIVIGLVLFCILNQVFSILKEIFKSLCSKCGFKVKSNSKVKVKPTSTLGKLELTYRQQRKNTKKRKLIHPGIESSIIFSDEIPKIVPISKEESKLKPSKKNDPQISPLKVSKTNKIIRNEDEEAFKKKLQLRNQRGRSTLLDSNNPISSFSRLGPTKRRTTLRTHILGTSTGLLSSDRKERKITIE